MVVTLEPIVADPPRSAGRAVMTQEWTRLTYLHWPCDPVDVARVLPAGIVPDTFDGAAWVGLIPFHMRRVTVPGLPPLPYVADFLETNVRTYTVSADGHRGVTFLSLDASRLLPVATARVSYRLPYFWARMRLDRAGTTLTYTSRRRWPGPRGASSFIRVRVGERVDASPLDDFLTARWGLHTTFGGRVAYAPVRHPRWPLRSAQLLDLDEGLIAASGLPVPAGPPRVLYSSGVGVRISPPHLVAPGTR